MVVALLQEPPLTPSADLGPYRAGDYLALPDEPRCELLLGRFYVSPSPSPLHQILVALLWQRLDAAAREAGGLVFLAPLDVALADHSIVQPDVIYVSAERRSIVQVQIQGTPDLLVEVLSRGTARRDRGEKLALYAQSGVREYWIVDPQERQIEFLVNEHGRFMVALPLGGEYRSTTLAEIRLDVAGFWQEVEDRLPTAV
jgi:Uma2 family endonuclease